MTLRTALAVVVAAATAVLAYPASAGAQPAFPRGEQYPATDDGRAVVDDSPPVSVGDRGRLVASWQSRLDEWLELVGSERHPLAVDGIFGPLTEAATLEFQGRHADLEPDGVVDGVDRMAVEDAVERLQEAALLPFAHFTTGPVISAGYPSVGPRASLVDVRTSAHVGFDRVVFEFSAPGDVEYRVGYVGRPALTPLQGAVDVVRTPVVEVHVSGPPHLESGTAGRVPEPSIDDLQVVDRVAPVEVPMDDVRWLVDAGGTTPLAVALLHDPLRLVVDVATPTTAMLLGPMSRCHNPDGFSVAYPRWWFTNDGDVAPTCSQFHPGPFDVPATDGRVAAITTRVYDLPFAELTAPDPARREERAATTIDGFPAVRLEHDSREVGFWPAGTPVSMYVVDLAELDGNPRTLVIDTVGIGGFDYEQHRVVLDHMARSLLIDRAGATTSTSRPGGAASG